MDYQWTTNGLFLIDYLPFGSAGGVVFSAGGVGFLAAFAGFAGRLLPKDPLNIFPFFVFLSPLPMFFFFIK
jgi:hypothetical protein